MDGLRGVRPSAWPCGLVIPASLLRLSHDADENAMRLTCELARHFIAEELVVYPTFMKFFGSRAKSWPKATAKSTIRWAS